MKVFLLYSLFVFIQSSFGIYNENSSSDRATDFWVLKLKSSSNPNRIAEIHGHHYVCKLGQLDSYFIFLKKTGLCITFHI